MTRAQVSSYLELAGAAARAVYLQERRRAPGDRRRDRRVGGVRRAAGLDAPVPARRGVQRRVLRGRVHHRAREREPPPSADLTIVSVIFGDRPVAERNAAARGPPQPRPPGDVAPRRQPARPAGRPGRPRAVRARRGRRAEPRGARRPAVPQPPSRQGPERRHGRHRDALPARARRGLLRRPAALDRGRARPHARARPRVLRGAVPAARAAEAARLPVRRVPVRGPRPRAARARSTGRPASTPARPHARARRCARATGFSAAPAWPTGRARAARATPASASTRATAPIPARPSGCVTPVMTLRDVRGVLRHPRELALEKLLPDAWCLLPRGRGRLHRPHVRLARGARCPRAGGGGVPVAATSRSPSTCAARASGCSSSTAWTRSSPASRPDRGQRRFGALPRGPPDARPGGERPQRQAQQEPAADPPRARHGTGGGALERGHHARRGVGVQPVRADERAQERLPRAPLAVALAGQRRAQVAGMLVRVRGRVDEPPAGRVQVREVHGARLRVGVAIAQQRQHRAPDDRALDHRAGVHAHDGRGVVDRVEVVGPRRVVVGLGVVPRPDRDAATERRRGVHAGPGAAGWPGAGARARRRRPARARAARAARATHSATAPTSSPAMKPDEHR